MIAESKCVFFFYMKMDTLKIVNFLTVRKHWHEKKQNNITVDNI